ncbi:hypothetical protein Tco_0568259 [Tanacetum coccineum]
MALSMADQIALDDALVAPADRLRIGKCNLRLSSDVTSKEATLQVVYDVLKLTPFYNAFQVTADAPEIYMQEFWASAYVHNRSVRFKMNNKKHIIGLEQFRDILQICPKVGNKKFVDPPLETEILIFLASLGHSGDIRKLTDVNVNKLHQPWRSFAAVINKCLSGTPSYNKKNVDYAYLLWEDFIFKIENKNTKKGNAMYYPRFTKLVVNYVMEKDPSIPRRNKVNWHYARDDPMLKQDIRQTLNPTREYYAMASGTFLTKTKGARESNTDAIPKQLSSTAPRKRKAEQLKIVIKRSRLETHSSHASGSGADEGTGITPGVPDAPDYDSDDDISWKSSDDLTMIRKAEDVDDEEMTELDNDVDDFVHPKLTTHEDELYMKRLMALSIADQIALDDALVRRLSASIPTMKIKVNWHFARDDPMFTTINVISRNEATQLYGAILPVALTNEDIRNSESYKEYYARASGTIPPKTKGSKKKATTDIITQQKPPTTHSG